MAEMTLELPSDIVATGTVRRFAPKYWECITDFLTAGSIVTTGEDSALCTVVLRRNTSLPGLYFWVSDGNPRDGARQSYDIARDWRGTILDMTFDFSGGIRSIEAPLGAPGMSINLGNSTQVIINLANYVIAGTGTDLVTVRLIFSDTDPNRVKSGFASDTDFDQSNILSMFFNLALEEYMYGSCEVKNNYTAGGTSIDILSGNGLPFKVGDTLYVGAEAARTVTSVLVDGPPRVDETHSATMTRPGGFGPFTRNYTVNAALNRITSPSATFDFQFLSPGDTIVMSGFENPGNDGSWVISSIDGGGQFATFQAKSTLGAGVNRLGLSSSYSTNKLAGVAAYGETTTYQALDGDEVVATLAITGVAISGSGSTIPIRQKATSPLNLHLAYDYSYVKVMTPERIADSLLERGYRGLINLYQSTTGFEKLAWSTSDPIDGCFGYPDGRWEVDAADPTFNAAFAAWAADLLARVDVIFSQSAEFLMHFMPEGWSQVDSDGNLAATGYGDPDDPETQPWTNLIDPCNEDAIDCLLALATDWKRICDAAGKACHPQFGEPGYWSGYDNQRKHGTDPKPCFYGAATAAAYLADTGQALPVISDNNPVLSAANRAAFAVLNGYVNTFLASMAAGYEALGATDWRLLALPEAFQLGDTMYGLVNTPTAAGAGPAVWSILQWEPYLATQTNNLVLEHEGFDILRGLGWALKDVEYFSGFVTQSFFPAGYTYPGYTQLWQNVTDFAARALPVFKRVFIWADPQARGVFDAVPGSPTWTPTGIEFRDAGTSSGEAWFAPPMSEADSRGAFRCARTGFKAPARLKVVVGGKAYIRQFAPTNMAKEFFR